MDAGSSHSEQQVAHTRESAKRRVIYVSYDGLADPLGQSQVLPYVLGLARYGHSFELISFEKSGARLRFRERLAPNVRWTALRYHQHPTVPATAFDMAQGLAALWLHASLHRADLVHVRSYVACALAVPFSLAARVPLLFDTRGFWPEERVEAGRWARDGRLFATVKSVERYLFRRADAITVLTHAFQDYLREVYPFRKEITAPIHVIPTCVDLERFSPTVEQDGDLRRELGGAATLAYVGSLGGVYMVREMARFYLAWRRQFPSARFLVVSRHDEPADLRDVLASGGAEQELVRRTATREQVPRMLRCAHAVVGFDARGFGGTGTAPTKLGEALACGLPAAVTPVGDVAHVLAGNNVGTLVTEFSELALERAARTLAALAKAEQTTHAARATAERWFSLDRGVQYYAALYEQIARRRPLSATSIVADRPWVQLDRA